jgi:DNA-binding transcriptional regulator YdaS (Cro superfamily)
MVRMEKVINYFGTQKKLADILGVTQMAISQWKKRGIPIKRCVQIEQLSNGKIKREEIWADIFNR